MDEINDFILVSVEKYNGEIDMNYEDNIQKYLFDDIESLHKSIPDDLKLFRKRFPFLKVKGWCFNILCGTYDEEYIQFGSIYLGLGYSYSYAFNKINGKIVILAGGSYITKKYDNLVLALQDLIANNFEWDVSTWKNG